MKKQYNWELMQRCYDAGNSWPDVAKVFGVTYNGLIRRAVKQGCLKSRSSTAAMKSASSKISASMKRVHAEGKHPGWLSVNLNKDNRTYPEQFFLNALNESSYFSQFIVLEKLQFYQYVFDFAIVEFKIDIEIDGRHHTDKNTVEKDKKRDAKASAEGWKIFRVSWDELRSAPKNIIKELKEFVEQFESTEKYTIGVIQVEPTGIRSFRAAKFKIIKADSVKPKREKNKYYPIESIRKVKRPTKDELLLWVWQRPTTVIAKELGVSDKAVDKWCKWYGISKPPRGYWTKVRSKIVP
ncbi:MAG: endonuclease domain-containing protein [Proteobacteria bacterium]|jgi:very-short-patch-repair endonuclease|nr:endonuclease domain-containing protein [Pseudomonadota bacterium]